MKERSRADRAAKRRAIIDTVRRIEPGLSAKKIGAAVDEACDITWRLTKVADALAQSPDCLVSGRSSSPVEVDRLAIALRAEGARRVSRFVCDRCGRIGRCQAVMGGEAICEACRRRRRAVCASCARTATVTAVWATGPVCSTCYQRALASKGVCEACGQRRRIDPRDPSDRRLCSDCAGLPPFSICDACGSEDRIWRNHRCFACNLSDRLDQVLAGSDGNTTAELSGLRSTLMATGSPRGVLRWLGRPGIHTTLAGMATGEIPINHNSLDPLGDHAWVIHLRHVLVASGVLPARDERTVRLEEWLEAKLDAMGNAEDRNLVGTFATWWVLRRRRARAGRRPVTSVGHAHQAINAAIGLVGWLRAHDRTLASATQADIDLWLTGPPVRRQARHFLAWARRRRVCGDLTIVRRPDPFPTPTANAAKLVAIARRLLVDDTVALSDRVAGLLVICYGQPASRIVELSVERIATEGETTTVRLGASDIELPETLGNLVRRLAAERTGRSIVADPDSSWLFPGAYPGRPMSAEHLQKRLGRLGIVVRAARTTMLLDLASEVPPAVIADLLGLYPNTAVRWVQAAAGDWNAYAAAKTRSS